MRTLILMVLLSMSAAVRRSGQHTFTFEDGKLMNGTGRVAFHVVLPTT